MTPRDANYLGDENHTCLLRQELLILAHRHKQVEHAKIKMKELEADNEKEKKEFEKEVGLEEGKETTVEQKKKIREFSEKMAAK